MKFNRGFMNCGGANLYGKLYSSLKTHEWLLERETQLGVSSELFDRLKITFIIMGGMLNGHLRLDISEELKDAFKK